MYLIESLNNSNEEQIESIIYNVLAQIIKINEEKTILGFNSNIDIIFFHKGLIMPNTIIRYSNLSMNQYSMKTTDYYYEFAKYIKDMGIKNKKQLIKVIENFLNQYFGIASTNKDLRDIYFNQIAWESTTTDEEYFTKLDSLEIGDLKGKNIAMCTERAAIAQNLLTLFNIESYYCIGCINNEGKEEPHCFNIAKAKDSYILLDYSMPCQIIKDNKIIDYAPFQAKISFDEIEEVLTKKLNKNYNSYHYIYTLNGVKKVNNEFTRTYVVGSFNLNREK